VAARWRPNEDRSLRRWYPQGVPVVEIARRLGRTAHAVDGRRRLLGLPPRRRPREWSARQDALLLASRRAGIPARIVADRLGLPLETVRRRGRAVDPRVAGRHWTPSEDERLRAALANGRPLVELARELGRTEGALRTRARERGLLPSAESRRRWSASEDDLLRSGYESGLTCLTIATELLGGTRTPETVSARASKLGLATYARSWTEGEDQALRRLGLCGASVSEAAERLARTPEAIRRRSRKLAVRLARDPFRGASRPWRPEEDALLRELSGLHPARLARLLNRSDQAIRRRRAALGINTGSPHHLPPAQNSLTPGERRLLAREYNPGKARRLLALAHRLGRTPAELRALAATLPRERAMLAKPLSERDSSRNGEERPATA
jgi:hypothetical protein